MQKIVISPSHGGFGLSNDSIRTYWDRYQIQAFYYRDVWYDRDPTIYPIVGNTVMFPDRKLHILPWTDLIKRDDPVLVSIVEEGMEPELKVITILENIEWVIEEYDGQERISEVHRTWD